MNHIKDALKAAGLTPAEIKVYLYLLKEGVSSPRQISLGTSIARTNTYHVLRKLDDLDLIKKRKKNNKFIYVADNPDAVIRSVTRRQEVLEKILPELHDLYKVQRNKPAVRYFDGLEEIKQIFTETLEAKDAIYGIESNKQFSDVANSFIHKTYNPKLRQKKIITKDILTHRSGIEMAKQTKKELGAYYDYRFMPKLADEYPGQIFIWDNKVALIILEQPYFGTVIGSKSLSGLMKGLFMMAWNSAGPRRHS